MNTNNRNVRLQEHVVLLTVMEHAEDLIKKLYMVQFCGYITITEGSFEQNRPSYRAPVSQYNIT